MSIKVECVLEKCPFEGSASSVRCAYWTPDGTLVLCQYAKVTYTQTVQVNPDSRCVLDKSK